jgi:c-di-GMP-binding flagellar brake protein YcgR
MDRGRPGPGKDRAHPRVAVDAFVRIVGPADVPEFVFRTRDLSVGGLFLYTRVGHMYPFSNGTALRIELYDYDQAVEFQAVVVRIVDLTSSESERFPLGFGVKIVEIDEANRKRLEALIARAQTGEPLY